MNGKELMEYCRGLSDAQLLFDLQALTAGERTGLIRILARLAAVGEREMEKITGYSSLFMFCLRRLRYVESVAHYRSKAAKACGRFPVLLDHLEAGRLNVTGVALLEEHLTIENHEGLIRSALDADRKALDRILAGMRPQALPPERTRVIAVAAGQTMEESPVRLPSGTGEPGLFDRTASEAIPAPVAPSMVEIRTEHRFTVGDETERKLTRARELLRHRFPFGELERVFDEALEALLDRIDPARKGARPDAAPRAVETRRIPNWVKRRVRERDGDACAFVSPDGARCGERAFLQFDHVRPWADGGRSDDPENIRQLCGAHNRWRERERREAALTPEPDSAATPRAAASRARDPRRAPAGPGSAA